MEDRISWCLAVGRYEAALSLAEADRTTTQELWCTVVQVRSVKRAVGSGDARGVIVLVREGFVEWSCWFGKGSWSGRVGSGGFVKWSCGLGNRSSNGCVGSGIVRGAVVWVRETFVKWPYWFGSRS